MGWYRTAPVARVFSPYTGVDTVIHRRETGLRLGSGGNGEAAALVEILLNNGNKGGTGMDRLIGLDLGLKLAKLASVRGMGNEKRNRAEISTGDR